MSLETNMNYQMIAMDLDGTLLNTRSQLSNKSIDTIEKLKNEGKYIIIASGRTYGEIIRLIEPLNLLDYRKAFLICYNGVLTVKTHPFTVLMKEVLHKEDIQSIIKAIGPTDIKYHIFAENKLYLSHDIVLSLAPHQSENTEIIKIDMSRYDLEDDVYKILFYAEKRRLEQFKKDMPALITEKYGVVRSNEQLLEIFHKEGSKGHALAFLAKYLHIPAEEVIAFGDEENDITMIQFAGLGIAMGNAKPDVISASKHITLTNEYDGVAVAIEKFIKMEKG